MSPFQQPALRAKSLGEQAVLPAQVRLASDHKASSEVRPLRCSHVTIPSCRTPASSHYTAAHSRFAEDPEEAEILKDHQSAVCVAIR